MSGWAMARHKRYLKEFDGKDGRRNYKILGRNAIFPFIY
jgi:hypothetical protein